MNSLEKKKIAENIARIRAENRKAIAQTIAARVLRELSKSPNLKSGISGREIAEILRPMTDGWLDYGDKKARGLDFENPDDLIDEVEPYIFNGLKKLREGKKSFPTDPPAPARKIGSGSQSGLFEKTG
jgi:hypothetical protein